MDAPRERQRMNPCAKQRLVGVDVADAPKKALVEQQRFDLRLAALHGRGELLEADFERLGAEFQQSLRKVLAVEKPAELAAVVVHHDAAVESEDGVRVFARGPTQQQAARHTKVDDEIPTFAFVEGEKDVLAI